MVGIVEEFIDGGIDFLGEHWKTILIFLVLIVLGVATILYQTIDELEQTGETIKEDSTKGIVETFADVGKETSENMDPATKIIYQALWMFLGVMFVLMIVLAITNAFKPIIEALNPWEIAKNLSR